MLDIYRLAFVVPGPAGTGPLADNRRLAFIGDAVLGSVASTVLFFKYMNLGPGELTEARALLVCRRACAHYATAVGLDKWIVGTSSTEESRSRILAEAFEAFIGALYVDHGYEKTHKWVRRVMQAHPFTHT
jgi:ribonuclease III